MAGNGEKNVANEKVVFYKLFSFADRKDIVLMAMGTICAVATGLAQPLISLIFGHLNKSFVTTEPSRIIHEVTKVSNNGWTERECKGKAGWFSFEYVKKDKNVF